MAPLTPMGALNAVRAADEARTQLIDSNKQRFKEIDEEAKQRKEDLRQQHRNANRALVEAIRLAQTYGIHVEDSARTIGKSPQAIYRIEQEVKKHDATPTTT